jgi:hypothetical protein
MIEGQSDDVEGNAGSFNPRHCFSNDTSHVEHEAHFAHWTIHIRGVRIRHILLVARGRVLTWTKASVYVSGNNKDSKCYLYFR